MSLKKLGINVFFVFSLQFFSSYLVYASDKHSPEAEMSFSAVVKKAYLNERRANSQGPCFYVLPVGGRDQELGGLLLNALIRYLSDKVPSIVRAPAELGTGSGEIKLSFPRSDGEQEHPRCPFLFALTKIVSEKSDLVFWAKKTLFVEIKLFSLSNNEEIWAKRHIVQRDRGGFPLSPFSSILDIRQVSNFKANKDLSSSMADDLMRELTRTIAFAR